jgi:hypothetical protein
VLANSEPPIDLIGGRDLRTSTGHVRVRMGSRLTGFDVSIDAISAEEIADYQKDLKASGENEDGFLAILTNHDTRVTLSGKNDDEITAARLVAQALTRLSGGVLSDPQTGEDS